MPLLKIGKTYINTDHVLKWNVNSTNGGGSINAIDKDGKNIEVWHAEKTKPEVMIALTRWLDANAEDIMATEPAPVETPEPRRFQIDDRVIVRDGCGALAGMVGSVRDIFGGALLGRCEVELDDYGLHMISIADLELEPAD